MSTRDELVSSALRHFAERGFHGASIAGIAEDLGVTKQALLHHFGTKERLYGAVLQGIAAELEVTLREATAAAGDPAARLEALLLALLADTSGDAGRLLMRELVDNRARAERAGRWYLEPFLRGLTAAMREVDGWRDASEGEAFAALYQLLGAVTYWAVSGPTLARILGKRAFAEVVAAYPARLSALVRATLSAPPGGSQAGTDGGRRGRPRAASRRGRRLAARC